MKRCAHCDSIIDNARRRRFCSDWCSKDYYQPEDNKSWDSNLHIIKDGIYIEDGDKPE